MIGTTKYGKYPDNSSFKENTLGCSLVGMKTYNSFFGEMTATHFIVVTEDNFNQVHRFITKITPFVEIEDFGSLVSEERINDTGLRQVLDSTNTDLAKLRESVFLSANPKLVTEDLQNIRHSSFQYGYIKSICNMTKVHHNLSLRDSFMNIGGISSLLTLIENIPNSLRHILNILNEIALSDSQHMMLFLKQEGIKTLSYVVEKLAKTLNEDIFSSLTTFKNTLNKYYLSSYIDYLELIYYNPRIWNYSNEEIKRGVLGSMVDSNEKVISCYMHFILELIDSSNSDDFLKLCADMFQRIIISKQVLNTIMANLMIYAGRVLQYKNCPVQMHLIFSCCLQLFNSSMFSI